MVLAVRDNKLTVGKDENLVLIGEVSVGVQLLLRLKDGISRVIPQILAFAGVTKLEWLVSSVLERGGDSVKNAQISPDALFLFT
jgi:hypothetical protein